MKSSTTISIRGVDVPRIGLGTWRMQGDTCRRAVTMALEMGYRHIDTAAMYENEEAVSAGLRDAGVTRADVFLVTKVWRDHVSAADLPRAAAASLRRLQTDYVDLLLLHWPNNEVPLEDQLGALVAEREAGRARLIGVCNYPPGLLARALEIVPDLACNQVEYHPMLGQNRLLVLAREHGMFLTAYSPIARNRFAGERVLQEIAATHGASVAQVSLAWLLSQEGVVAIPKASNREHLEENLGALDLELTPAELGAIDLLPKDQRIVDPGFVDFDERGASVMDLPRRIARGAWHAGRRLLRGNR